MSDVIVTGLISGVVGVIAVLIPAIKAIRTQPTRRTTDAISLVDASGRVIGNLSDEITRLDTELEEERQANDGLRKEIRTARDEAEAARAEADHCRKQVEPLKRRIEHLEAVIVNAGLDPDGDTPQPPKKGTS